MAAKAQTVYYDHLDTDAVGEVWFAVGARGIWSIHFGSSEERFLDSLARSGVIAKPHKRHTAAARKELREYFAGKRQSFDLKLDWSRLQGFDKRALQACARIPFGKTLSYGEIAQRAGSPGAARAAGQAMGKNPFPIIVPCHRVIAAGGKIGGYGGGLHHKRTLLDFEGIVLPSERPKPPRGLRSVAPPGIRGLR